eukprot:m.69268 g.69268  ORF g.69268 m.69268 type:complete len:157 (-) comp14112_c0_seq1:1040-1510(-)
MPLKMSVMSSFIKQQALVRTFGIRRLSTSLSSRASHSSSSSAQAESQTKPHRVAALALASAATIATMSTMALSQPTSTVDKTPLQALRTQVTASPTEGQGLPSTTATITRLMLPDSANPAGNVHGGSILAMVDEVCNASLSAAYLAPQMPDNLAHS